MSRIVSVLVALLLLLAVHASAAPDAVVFEGGDVRINGTGNGLVFPDGTIQTTKTIQGPAGPANTLAIGTVTTGASGSQAAATITGTSPNQVLNLTIPQGPQGPPGVVNGISKGVHGTVVGTNIPGSSGTGFSVVRPDIGTYDITFSPEFSGTPTCVISPVGHAINGTNGFIGCEVVSISATGTRVGCKGYYVYVVPPAFVDTTFSFICVQ